MLPIRAELFDQDWQTMLPLIFVSSDTKGKEGQ